MNSDPAAKSGHAVELTFHSTTERRILEVWKSIHVGIDLITLGARPHISLAAFHPPADAEILIACVGEFAAGIRPFDLVLSAVGTFAGEEGVVFLSPSPTPELLQIHNRLHGILRSHSVTTDEMYEPGRWVPHCTMALDVPDSELPAMVEQVRTSDALGPLRIEGVNIVEFRPVKEIFSSSLNAEPSHPNRSTEDGQ